MKRFVFLFVIGILAISVYAAAPAYNEWAAYLGDTLTVDSQSTATQWELLDSIIVIKTDTCRTVYTMSGVLLLNPGTRAYLGFDDGGGAGGAPIDTFLFTAPADYSAGKIRIPFSVRYLDSLVSQTDANDTIYFYAAKGGSGVAEKVVIEKGILTVDILDWSAAGIVGE